jgi:hypothetical protein
MLRRLLIIWCAVSILGYGMVAVADVHEIATDQVEVIEDHATNTSDTDHAYDCDHSCHSVNHLLGLISAILTNLVVDHSLLRIPHSISLNSFSPPLVLRPPITV